MSKSAKVRKFRVYPKSDVKSTKVAPVLEVENHFALIVYNPSARRFFAFNPKKHVRILDKNELFGLSRVARNELLKLGYPDSAILEIRRLSHAPVISGIQYHFTMASVSRVRDDPNLFAILEKKDGSLSRLAAETLAAVAEATALLGSATTSAA